MNHVGRVLLGALLLSISIAVARAGELFKLSNSQSISCSRSFASQRLKTATCTSYTYLFNTTTSEHFRCQVSLALTQDNKEVIIVTTDGHCTRKPRVFTKDSSYAFDATETGPWNTNSLFGQGGYSIWAADTTQQKVRGCITISTGLGPDVSRCVDMTFQ